MVFYLLLLKTLVVGTHYNCLNEAVLTNACTHNLCFGAKIGWVVGIYYTEMLS